MFWIITFFRFILFSVFFVVGASAVVLSLMVGEIEDNYRSREQLRLMHRDIERLENLIADYELQIEQVKQNPEAVARLKRVALGIEPQSDDTAYPKAGPEEFAAAAAAIKASRIDTDTPLKSPIWVQRTMEPKFRQSLFVAGSGLTLITLLFFGSGPKRQPA
ncbi:MAG: hypothetical protein KAS23_12385 [Anaerohalosphaera sp.]|nr:hypothetical protein [Anaerohalosphaera sp.]